MAVNIPNGHKIDKYLPSQDPPKLTQIGIFGLKICDLATLVVTRNSEIFFGELARHHVRKFGKEMSGFCQEVPEDPPTHETKDQFLQNLISAELF
jgi:hypothetical protein